MQYTPCRLTCQSKPNPWGMRPEGLKTPKRQLIVNPPHVCYHYMLELRT